MNTFEELESIMEIAIFINPFCWDRYEIPRRGQYHEYSFTLYQSVGLQRLMIIFFIGFNKSINNMEVSRQSMEDFSYGT